MPSRLNSPVITVDMNHISKIDPSNVDNLFSMWTIFSKCAESLENGRRLENLSWRLWNRETFCCEGDTTISRSVPQPIRKPKRQDSSDNYSDSSIPELSSSVESAPSDDELLKERSDAVGIETSRPCIIRSGSVDRYRGKEKHMTPDHLARIMEDIDRNKASAEEWISRVPRKPSPVPAPIKPPTAEMPASPPQRTAAEDSSLRSSHSVVRGFSPGRICSYRSSTSMAAAAPKTSQQTRGAPSAHATKQQGSGPVPPKKSKPLFYLGTSSSLSEDDDDDDLEESYRRYRQPVHGPKRLSPDKKTSFREEVSTKTVYDEDATTTDEDPSESAIEEEDESDWESSSDSGESSYDDDTMFRRVESKPELTSRRSLLSTMLHEPQRAAALVTAASRSTPAIRNRHHSPRAPSAMAPTKEEMHQASHATTRARPITMTATNMHPPALSPRTTRRNMLATELTESLRKHLLWERQQKNPIAIANLKRRHTSHDVTKLTEYPGPNGANRGGCSSKNNSWNNNNNNNNFDPAQYEYHQTGW